MQKRIRAGSDCCELSPAERAIHIAKRKAIYERKHGPAKAVGARASNAKQGKGKADASAKLAVAFTKDTARKSGQSERSIQRDASRARSIPKIAEVVGTSLDKGEELDALAKLPDQNEKAGSLPGLVASLCLYIRGQRKRVLANMTAACG